MKLWIPPLGSIITLCKAWTASVPYERRNLKFIANRPMSNGHLLIEFPVETVLKIDRIYIRQGAKDYDSITFSLPDAPKSRFWVKLANANMIEYVPGRQVKQKAFFIETRFQDGGWQSSDFETDDLELVTVEAVKRSKQPIIYGMVRVCHRLSGSFQVILVIPAGGFTP